MERPKNYNYNLNGPNSSGQPVHFQATNKDGGQILPYFNVTITDEGERNYRLDHKDVVLFFFYYLRLSSDARAASQGEILSNFFAQLPMKPDFMDELGDSMDILSDDARDMVIRAINIARLGMQHIGQGHAAGLSRKISNANNVNSSNVGAFINITGNNTVRGAAGHIIDINVAATPNNVELSSGGAGIININAPGPNNVEPVIDSSGPTVTYTSPEPSSYAPSSYTVSTKPSSSGICKLVKKVVKVIKAFGGIFSPSRLRKSKVRAEKLAQHDEVPSSSAIPDVQKPEVTKSAESEKASSTHSPDAGLDDKAASGSASGLDSTAASKALQGATQFALDKRLPGASDQSVCDSEVTQLPQVEEEGIVQTMGKVIDAKTS